VGLRIQQLGEAVVAMGTARASKRRGNILRAEEGIRFRVVQGGAINSGAHEGAHPTNGTVQRALGAVHLDHGGAHRA
jgi:hypothetical protein